MPGFVHDVGSAVYPLGISSPFFRTLGLAELGLGWIQPPAPLAHPLDDGTAVLLERSVEATCRWLACDAEAYQNLAAPLVKAWHDLEAGLLVRKGARLVCRPVRPLHASTGGLRKIEYRLLRPPAD